MLLIAIVQWAIFVRPSRLRAHELLIGRTIDQLRREHPACHIVSHCAWASYFDEPSLDTPALPARDLWRDGHLAELYYLYDEAPGFAPPLEEILSRPHELISSLKLKPTDQRIDLY